MKSYSREVTAREAVNRFGKICYVLKKECVKTDDITPFNKGKKIRFREDPEMDIYLKKLEQDTVYTEVVKILSKTW